MHPHGRRPIEKALGAWLQVEPLLSDVLVTLLIVTDKSDQKEEGSSLPHNWRVQSIKAGSHALRLQSGKRGWMVPPASLILFLHFKTPVYSMMSPTVRVSLQLIKSRNFCISLPPFKIHLQAWVSLGQPALLPFGKAPL